MISFGDKKKNENNNQDRVNHIDLIPDYHHYSKHREIYHNNRYLHPNDIKKMISNLEEKVENEIKKDVNIVKKEEKKEKEKLENVFLKIKEKFTIYKKNKPNKEKNNVEKTNIDSSKILIKDKEKQKESNHDRIEKRKKTQVILAVLMSIFIITTILLINNKQKQDEIRLDELRKIREEQTSEINEIEKNIQGNIVFLSEDRKSMKVFDEISNSEMNINLPDKIDDYVIADFDNYQLIKISLKCYINEDESVSKNVICNVKSMNDLFNSEDELISIGEIN
jgi:hypothetical protein